ncbi:hypothetical protein J6Q66_00940 [bacterium]|nr:hypothetical protein [bacterium]
MITYDSIAAMRLNRYVFDFNTKLNNINKQLETGSTINKGADGPATFNFTAHVKGYSQLYNTANQNATDGIAMIDIGKDAIKVMQNKLSQIEDILKEAKKTGVSGEKREEMQAQIDKLTKEIYEIKQNTGFNGFQIFEEAKVAGGTPIVPETPDADDTETTKYITPVISKTDVELEDEGYIVIHTAQEFIDAINDDLYTGIALGTDIDFEGIDYVSLGTNNNPFSGIINGNGYKIKNLTIESSDEYVGLFGATDGAIIENVILENVNIKGDRYVGALIGKAFSTTITNSYVLGGTVEGNNNVGGLIGYADSSEITTSYTELDLVKANMSDAGGFIGDILKTNISKSYAKTTVETDGRGGVFTGGNNSSNIENSFACGEVIGRSGIGGFSGRNVATTISNSYSSVNVIGTTDVGAFIGEFVGNSASNIVENSFFDFEVAGMTDAVGTFYSSDATQVATLAGINTSQMTTPSTFTDAGWDTNIWHLKAGKTPQLREIEETPFPEKEDEPDYLGRLQAVEGPLRVQTGKDNSTASYVMVDTRLKFDESFNFHAESSEFAEKSLENVAKVKEQLTDKTNDFNLSRKILESQANATSIKTKNGKDVLTALTGFDTDALQAEKSKLLSDLANAKALRDSSRALNAEVCKTLVLGAIYGKSYSPFSAISNIMQ